MHYSPVSDSQPFHSQGEKGSRSEISRERIGQDPIGQFAPGSELARERKGSVLRIRGLSVSVGVWLLPPTETEIGAALWAH